MQITLTNCEVEKAITSYLKANAAVDVTSIKFSARKCGLEAVVETTIKEPEIGVAIATPTPILNAAPVVPLKQMEFSEAEAKPEPEFTEQQLELEFEHKPEELLEEETIGVIDDTARNDGDLTLDDNVSEEVETQKEVETETEELIDLDEAIANVEAAADDVPWESEIGPADGAIDLIFDEPESDEPESTDIPETQSLADILSQ